MLKKRMVIIIVLAVLVLALGTTLLFTLSKKNKPVVEEEPDDSSSEITEALAQPVIFYATTNVRLRSEPDTSQNNRIAGISRGGSVELLDVGKTEIIDGIKAPWFKVRAEDGKVGWVYSGYLTISMAGDFQTTGTVLTEYKGKSSNVIIPNGVTRIGESAFYRCIPLVSVIIPNTVTSIGGGAFFGCANLSSVTIPNSVTNIDNAQVDEINTYGAFGNCTKLTTITIPNSVTNIGKQAFLGSGLTSITIPKSVKSIGSMAFNKCTNLTNVTFQGTIPEANFDTNDSFPGNLRDKFFELGPGKYSRQSGSETWTKQ